MKKILLLADDFTGANDSGIKMVQRGYKASISIDFEYDNKSQITIIDSETRNLPEDEAYDKIEKIISKVDDLNEYLFVYKKIDSTLRGNIRKEYEAIVKHLNPKYIIFAPAHPNLNRTTNHGIQYVNNKRVLDSEFAEDPKKPVFNDDIRNILSNKYTHHDIKEIRNDLYIKPGVNTFDCETYDDLLLISRESLKINDRVLFIGSAGLFDSLFDELIIKKPSLAIVGSVSSQNRLGIKYCEEMGVPVIDITLRDFVDNSTKEKIDSVIEYLKSDKDVVIVTSRSREEYIESIKYLESKELNSDIILSKLINEISEKIVKKCELSGVFTTGGTTSIEFLKSINAKSTNLIDEIEDGVILSEIKGIYKDLYLVTKAGAFGNERTIYKALSEIRRISV